MDPHMTPQTSYSSALTMLFILFAGIVVLYCIRKRLMPQLLFLLVFAIAALTVVFGLGAGSTWLIITGLVVALAAVAGYTRAYNRRQAPAT